MTSHPALRSRAAHVLSWNGHIDRMLLAESALARAQAGLGIIPADAADAISAACERGIDRTALAETTAGAATPAIPLVGLLREAVGKHGAYVHHGTTSQDIIDTALVLQVRDAISILLEELEALGTDCADLADQHRETVMVGRTLLQHAVPVTFGLKAAHWLSAITRHVERLSRLRDRLPVQLGGAAGTLAPFGDDGVRLMQAFADELDLAVPDLPWHTDRDILHEAVAGVGLVAVSMGKVALDLILMMQTEVGELIDPSAGGSSTMPQKRNPVDPAFASASARLALAELAGVLPAGLHEHERAAGAWQAEWTAVPRTLDHTVAATERVGATLGRIQVDVDAMRNNLDRTNGAVMAESLTLALAPHLGRDEAASSVSAAVDRAARDGTPIREAVASDDRVRELLSGEDLARMTDPTSYLGSSDAFVERALIRWRGLARG